MRIVFIGTGEFGVPALDALVRAGHEIVATISQPDRPAGRGRVLQPTPIRTAAARLGCLHIQTDDINSLDMAAVSRGAEIGVVAAFGQKIGRAVLDAFPRGCVNIHGSLLPKYRGAAPYQWAILNGDETTGVTILQLDEHWDTGPIWAQRSIAIGATETADELHDRLAVLGAELIVVTLADMVTGRIRPVAQDPTQATRAPKLTKADGYVDWSWPAARVARRINGLWSWPAAACLFVSRSGRQERVLLARAAVGEQATPPTDATPPGTFSDGNTVQTGCGRVRLLELKPAGGKLMAFDAFAHGRRVGPGDRLLRADPQ